MYKEIIKETIPVLKQIIANHNIQFKPDELVMKLKENEEQIKNKIQECMYEVQKDYEAANFGLKTKKPTALQKTVLNVSYTHALCEIAWYKLSLIGINKKDYIK